MYNIKQYDAAIDFLGNADGNITDAQDKRRIQVYDLYENIYNNATATLRIVLRGDDQHPVLIPTGRKIVDATDRFLGVNIGYYVEPVGDSGVQKSCDDWWQKTWKREAIPMKFASNKLWGLVRGDAYFYISANPKKAIGERLSITELDPRQVFEIEEGDAVVGVHLVDLIQDPRDKDKPDKQIARRRTFRKIKIADGQGGETSRISSELTYWEFGKWDDRSVKAKEDQEPVHHESLVEEDVVLPKPISQLPVYKWRTRAPQNSNWGVSILSGLETLLYAINQSISDEDATLVFQGLGMYVTNAPPPIDENGQVTDWNIGPKQVIEISTDQSFERVSGLSDVSPFIDHMTFMDEKGVSESSGTPEIAIGRVDVTVAESGIALNLQMMPLIASNAKLELEMINILDQFFHDITTMWLPAYETETFGGGGSDEPTDDAIATMSEMSVVVLFDDPMPRNRDADIQEVVLLDSSNLILKTMTIAKLRELGWKYPTEDAMGNPLTDDDIAAMLLDQAKQSAAALDPFASQGGGGFDQNGNPIDPNADPNANTPPDQKVIDLGLS